MPSEQHTDISREELANAITHGFGLLLSIAGAIALIAVSMLHGTAWHIVSCTAYGTTLVLLYLSSTLYHAISAPRLKPTLRLFDHSAVYLLIAGTYTPFTLVNLRGGWGWTLFGVVWGLTLVGIGFKYLAIGRDVNDNLRVHGLAGGARYQAGIDLRAPARLPLALGWRPVLHGRGILFCFQEDSV